MNTLFEILDDTSINVYTVTIKMIVSFLLGVSIGIERQIRRRDAGMRTFTLICTGSTGAMLISIWIPQIYPDFLNGDPGRIAAQVLTGVGFLGAGAIARGKGSVQGLTTAACIWQTAVIGLAVGSGQYMGAILITLITLFVLVSVDRIEQRMYFGGVNRILVVKCKSSSPDIDSLKHALEQSNVIMGSYTYAVDIESNESTITFKITIKHSVSQQALLKNIQNVPLVSYINMMD